MLIFYNLNNTELGIGQKGGANSSHTIEKNGMPTAHDKNSQNSPLFVTTDQLAKAAAYSSLLNK